MNETVFSPTTVEEGDTLILLFAVVAGIIAILVAVIMITLKEMRQRAKIAGELGDLTVHVQSQDNNLTNTQGIYQDN